MNKVLKFILTLSAVIYTTSCSEMITADFSDKNAQITVKSEVELTKAGYEGTTSLPSEFIMDINQGSDSKYNYSLIKMTKESTGNTYKAASGTSLMWAKADHSNVTVKAMTIPNGRTSVNSNSAMEINVSLDQRTEDNLKKSDLLGAKTGNGIFIEGNDINISFNHLMSKMYINYKLSSRLKNNNARVTSITLKNVCVTGGYSYANMNYDSSITKKNGNISMYLDDVKTRAEAVFYPYTPSQAPTLSIRVQIGNSYKDIEYPLSLNANSVLEGGKVYKMAIKISGTSLDNLSVAATDESLNISGKRILWLGTSIPAGTEGNNYPQLVAEALGCEVKNNAQPGSRVTLTLEPTWKTLNQLKNEYKYLEGFSLGATAQEIDDKYRPYIVNTTYENGEKLSAADVELWVNYMKSQSYEKLLLPYIDGTKDSFEIVIIDHSLNDYKSIINECIKHKNNDVPSGINWVESLCSSDYVDEYNLGKHSYFVGLNHLIDVCYSVNPNIKIIIGNYFATRSPSIYEYVNDGGAQCCELMLAANEAIAKKRNLDIVNVYKYTGLDDTDYVSNFFKFCPDKVHPHSNTTGESNRIIANVYIDALTRIFNEEQE